MVVGNSGIVLGQNCSDSDKLIHYTERMDKMCLECLVNSIKKDSLLINMKLQLFNTDSIISSYKIKSLEFESSYKEEKEISSKLNLSLEKSKKRNNRLLVIGPLIGILLGILISN